MIAHDPQFIVRDPLNERAKVQERERLEKFYAERGMMPPYSLGELLGADLTQRFLVDKVLQEGKSCVIAGASKSMKTTLSLHLAISIATGKPFLGKLDVVEQRPVLIASAESGIATLRRNLVGMIRQAGLNEHDVANSGMIHVADWVPRANTEQVEYFADQIRAISPGVVLIDPLYMALTGENQANLSKNGDEINSLIKPIRDCGATAIINDHVKRSSSNATNYQPLQLEDISGVGKAEIFRQWLLVGRRSRFEAEEGEVKQHELWLTAGGSDGHSGSWGLDITETFNSAYTEVEYDIATRSMSEVRSGMTEQKVSRKLDAESEKDIVKEQVKQQKLMADSEKVLRLLLSESVITKSDIRSATDRNGQNVLPLIAYLEQEGMIVRNEEKKRCGTTYSDCWRKTGEIGFS